MSLKKSLAAAVAAATISSFVNAETIDIGIVYTEQAEAYTGNISAKIDQYITYANNSFDRNDIDIQLNLVGTASISRDRRPTEDDIRAIAASSDYQNWRASKNADMVILLGMSESDGRFTTCGIAFVGEGSNGTMYPDSRDSAYSITAVDCGYNTFVHELGHNLGLSHSVRQGDTSGGVYSYGLGHGVLNKFSTIMAYPHSFNTTTQYDWFSDPDWVECSGLPCGERVNGQDISNAYRALGPVVDDVAGYY
ncbi:zinc-dependent metalloprotease family protein [Microbulbifer epialgicus]|uniref:Zinc-dependent metalloprotease family protein n=1 Tax=Microbulbifer epialgicus TaxID=393907 RepID=A0ABV4NVU7_9GAMM